MCTILYFWVLAPGAKKHVTCALFEITTLGCLISKRESSNFKFENLLFILFYFPTAALLCWLFAHVWPSFGNSPLSRHKSCLHAMKAAPESMNTSTSCNKMNGVSNGPKWTSCQNMWFRQYFALRP